MPAIGFVTLKEDGVFEGSIKTLTIKARIVIRPVPHPGERGPHFRIFADGVELGGVWRNFSKSTGEEYLSGKLQDPSIPTIFFNLVLAGGQDDPSAYVLLWNPKN